MNPEQLWETTLNPEARSLYQVTIEQGNEAHTIFESLMGDVVEPRSEFIQDKRAQGRQTRHLTQTPKGGHCDPFV